MSSDNKLVTQTIIIAGKPKKKDKLIEKNNIGIEKFDMEFPPNVKPIFLCKECVEIIVMKAAKTNYFSVVVAITQLRD